MPANASIIWLIMAAILMTAILMTALALPATADAQVERKCRPVAGGPWKATGISVYNVNCRSARAKLRPLAAR